MIYRKEFERCTPEAVGIPSSAISEWITELECGGFTQMHGLMIMRHGKICAEGWWAPFAPGLHHCDHSLSKTYTATAVGIAEQEGLLKLTDPVSEIFPDKMPATMTERLRVLNIKNLLVMGNGSETEPEGYPPNWMEQYFVLPIEHAPGTHWRYNSHTTAVLSAIVERVSGESLLAYLKPRLFDKIGIDAANVLCRKDAAGTCLGGHGFFTTTEDNLRLMKLYLNGGIWDGERILGSRFVQEATSVQLDTSAAHAHTPWIYDNCQGYGYQIWMCRPEGSYRADGAYGQFSVVIPSLDMIVSIHEDAYLGTHMSHNELHLLQGQMGEDAPLHGPQATLNSLFDIVIPQVAEKPLADSDKALQLKERMRRLSVPHPGTALPGAFLQRSLDVRLVPLDDKISFRVLYGMAKYNDTCSGADSIRLQNHSGMLHISWMESGTEHTLLADMRGGRTQGKLQYDAEGELLQDISASAWWDAEGRLQVDILWIEAVDGNRFTFSFGEREATVEKCVIAGVNGEPGYKCARYRIAG